MELFRPDPGQNLLPRDGAARYFGPVLTPREADAYFAALRDRIPWRHDELVMFGKRVVTPRKVAWFADRECDYRYSGTTKRALEWTAGLLALKAIVENAVGAKFNACLLNLYHHGGEGMGWHSDDERSLVENAAIASLSFGAERKFAFRHKVTRETVSLTLEHGGLLAMEGETQKHWLHSLPKTARVTEPRINLTFRRMAAGDRA